ncbi:MAG: Hpt domain-containing protein [Planctomycetaceae bacterium]|nr:Hpt domain-containing protein [Planctomycetaceae bacterium]
MVNRLSDDMGPSLIDPQIFDQQQLLLRCMGNLEVAERCLTRFRQRLEADVEQLQQSATVGDTGEVARLAHFMKGSAATVAATALSQKAHSLECAARDGGTEEIEFDRATREFMNEAERFIEAVARLDENS